MALATMATTPAASAKLDFTRAPEPTMGRRERQPKSNLGDLYVMQNEHGLIKIGRSADPQKRQRELESSECCIIKIVLVLPGDGHREEVVHHQLRRYHIEGEWFEGTKSARKAIGRILAADGDLDWPFELNAVTSKEWLGYFFLWRDERRLLRSFDYSISLLKNGKHDPFPNESIWSAYCISEHGVQGFVISHGDGSCEGSWSDGPRVRIPPYATEVWAAMTLWPDDARPAHWDGTALECSMAALRERRRRMPTGR